MVSDRRVWEWMVRSVPVITPRTSVQAALRLARDHGLTELPVCEQSRLVGLVGERELLDLTPSHATTLSRFEIGALLDKVTVRGAMKPASVTVGPDAPLCEAAAIMVKRSAEALPVVEGDRFVGLIRWVDILEAALEDCRASATCGHRA